MSKYLWLMKENTSLNNAALIPLVRLSALTASPERAADQKVAHGLARCGHHLCDSRGLLQWLQQDQEALQWGTTQVPLAGSVQSNVFINTSTSKGSPLLFFTSIMLICVFPHTLKKMISYWFIHTAAPVLPLLFVYTMKDDLLRGDLYCDIGNIGLRVPSSTC